MPSLAQRTHEEHIDWVIKKALNVSHLSLEKDIDAVAVTTGPGLAIALGVGITKAKGLAIKYKKPLIAVNHLEGHILSCLAQPRISKSKIQNPKSKISILNSQTSFPSLGLVVSGGNTLLVQIDEIGIYKTLAATVDDALGEALDKAARMLGLGYPGGAILERLAKEGNQKSYRLPIPIVGHEDRKIFTYSGLKTAMWRLVEAEKNKNKGVLSKRQVVDLASSFQNVAFTHLVRILRYIITNSNMPVPCTLFVGGGVSANIELRKRLRMLGKENNIHILFPYTKKLTGDNAAMIGVAAYYKTLRGELEKEGEVEKVDRDANAKIDQ